jgi:drug/metabolite transporter (DMT)-like permease
LVGPVECDGAPIIPPEIVGVSSLSTARADGVGRRLQSVAMLAVVLALGAAAVFGTATALQHRAASGVSHAEVASGRLVARLLQRPGWLAGIALSGVAFVLHVAALHEGPLSLVQPIVVTTTVFAVFIRSGLDRTRPDLAEIVWAVCTCVGLTVFVVSAGMRGPHPHPRDHTAGLMVVAGVVVAALAFAAAARPRQAPARRGFLLGVAAGILYGLTAGLIKVSTSHVRHGLLPMLEHWAPWLVAPAGLTAFFISQRAYQATRLSVSAPVLNIVDVLVAVTFGAVVFGDRLFSSPGRWVGELVGASLMGLGVWRLVREDERLHERQRLVVEAHRPVPPKVGTDREVS